MPESFGAAASHVVVLRCSLRLCYLIPHPQWILHREQLLIIMQPGVLDMCHPLRVMYLNIVLKPGARRRSKGNFATPAVAADVMRLVLEGGIRLIMVLGHTHCAAIDIAVERWLEKRASAWPWAPHTGAGHRPSSAQGGGVHAQSSSGCVLSNDTVQSCK